MCSLIQQIARISFVLIPTLCLAISTGRADVVNQKKELKQIVDEVESSQRVLDSLRKAENALQKQIADYDQRITSDRKVIGRLNRQLNELKSDIGAAEEQLADRELSLELSRRRYLGDIRQTYLTLHDSSSHGIFQPNGELEAQRQVVYLVALAGFESGNVQQANTYLEDAVGILNDLTGQKTLVNDLKKKREVSYSIGKSKKEKQERSLDRVKLRKQDEADRLLTLKQAATEIESIIARLEAEQAMTGQEFAGGSAFETMKGQLAMPFRGRVVTHFGPSEDPVTKLKSFSPGIVLEGRSGGTVRAVASGKVAYAGSLRGYGNFVIIRHDRHYFTTYAGLARIDVAEGQFLQAGTAIGAGAEDGRVRFELRRGSEALDPVEWIKFEAL